MIKIRIPTPSEDKLKLIESFNPYAWSDKYTYVHVSKKDLGKLRKIIIDNSIAKADDIEEIDSEEWSFSIEEMSKVREFLKSMNVDFEIHSSLRAKLSRKELKEFSDWQIENTTTKTSKVYFNIPEQKVTVFQDACTKFYRLHKYDFDDLAVAQENGKQLVYVDTRFVQEFKIFMNKNNFKEI